MSQLRRAASLRSRLSIGMSQHIFQPPWLQCQFENSTPVTNGLILFDFVQLSAFVAKNCCAPKKIRKHTSLVCHRFLGSHSWLLPKFYSNNVSSVQLKALGLLSCTKASSNFFRPQPLLGKDDFSLENGRGLYKK